MKNMICNFRLAFFGVLFDRRLQFARHLATMRNVVRVRRATLCWVASAHLATTLVREKKCRLSVLLLLFFLEKKIVFIFILIILFIYLFIISLV